MSFILDALKKAESEHHRASGPVLVDVRIAPPRRRLPGWAWALGGVLVANLAVLAWLALREPVAPPAVASTAAPAPASPAPVLPVPETTLPPATPALPPAQFPPPAAAPATQPMAVDQLPTAKQLQARGVSLPPLLMNLHAYDAAPAHRYVLLNGLRLTEGEFTPDGIRVETITERGVVLEARGQRFLLPAGG